MENAAIIRKLKNFIPENAKNKATDSVSDYYSYLQKNYDCVKNGSVEISGSYLKKCAKNPEKAKGLEENLSFFKEGYERGIKSAQAGKYAEKDGRNGYRHEYGLKGITEKEHNILNIYLPLCIMET